MQVTVALLENTFLGRSSLIDGVSRPKFTSDKMGEKRKEKQNVGEGEGEALSVCLRVIF